MNQVVPPRFLFRWSFSAKRNEAIPSDGLRLLDLSQEFRIPTLGEFDRQTDFANVSLAWNDRGFAFSVTVLGRTRPIECQGKPLELCDGVRLWIDTRNTQTVHRATKFCHHFVLLPAGGGAKKTKPVVRALPVARAREETPLPDVSLVKIQADVTKSGYWIDAWFPAEVFIGFDPSTHPRIGFHYFLHDSELGDQTLAVGREFPFESDPSLWQTVELTA
jgi:hypothetical protein